MSVLKALREVTSGQKSFVRYVPWPYHPYKKLQEGHGWLSPHQLAINGPCLQDAQHPQLSGVQEVHQDLDFATQICWDETVYY